MWNNNKEIDLLEMLNKALIIFRRTWFLLILLEKDWKALGRF